MNSSSVSKPGKLQAIEVARALAVLLVMLLHYAMTVTPLSGLPIIGAVGVDIFFVISGFVIAKAAENGNETLAFGRAWRFALMRLGRVFPLWVAAAALYALAVGQPLTVEDLLLFPTQNDQTVSDPLLFVGWTLRFELLFYGLMSLALLTTRPIGVMLVVLPMLFGIGLLVDRSTNPLLAVATSPFLLEFWFGLLLYLAWRRGLVGGGGWRTVALLALLVAAAVVFRDFGYVPRAVPREYLIIGDGPPLPRWLLWGVPSGLVVFLLLRLSRQLSGRFGTLAALVGSSSFVLYLLHPFVMVWLGAIFHASHGVRLAAGVAVASTTVTLAAGVALYLWVDRPLYAAIRGRARQPLGPASARADRPTPICCRLK